MALIDEGKMAAAFALKDQNGKTHRLSDYTGRPKESCDFGDNLPKFKKSKAVLAATAALR